MDEDKSLAYYLLARIDKEFKRFDDEKKNYCKCIELTEKLFAYNSNYVYLQQLSSYYIYYGSLLDAEFNEVDEAEKYYSKGIKLINDNLKNSNNYKNIYYVSMRVLLSRGYKALGKLYYKIYNYDKAEKNIKESIQIIKKVIDAGYNYKDYYIDLHIGLLSIYREEEELNIYNNNYKLAKNSCEKFISLIQYMQETFKNLSEEFNIEIEEAKKRIQNYEKYN